MATLSETNNKMHQVSMADVGPADVIVTWLLKRFKELPDESLRDIVLLMEIITNPETPPEERNDMYETIREILFPQLIGTVQIGHIGQTEQIPDKVQQRTNWVGNKVKKRREKKGFTQSKLAEKSGLRQPQISRLEAGLHSPSFKTLEKIANALGITVGDLDPSN
jgi:DNA-binding XRE family transcriptional regulator